MTLYKYFKKASDLPNPIGPLRAVVPSESIASAIKVELLLKKPESSAKRGPYLVFIFTDEERLMAGKRAAEMGVASMLRFCQKQFADRTLKESLVNKVRAGDFCTKKTRNGYGNIETEM